MNRITVHAATRLHHESWRQSASAVMFEASGTRTTASRKEPQSMTTSVPTLTARRMVWVLSGRAAGGSSRRDRTSLSSATSRMGMAPKSFRVVNLEVHANVNDEHVHPRGSLTHPGDSWGEVPHRNNPPGAGASGPARLRPSARRHTVRDRCYS